MPYIKQNRRPKMDKIVRAIVEAPLLIDGDINYIKQLEAQTSITSIQLQEIIKKEQSYRYLAKRLRGLMSKEVRG